MDVVTMLDGEPAIECPGCGAFHRINVNDRNPISGARWTWNEDLEFPTFNPSINARWQQFGKTHVCHFFVRQGVIEFCSDSTHELSGKASQCLPV